MSISSGDDANSTESDSKSNPEHHPDVAMRMEDDVDAPDGVDLDSDVDMQRDGDDEEKEDEEEEDKVEEDKEEEEDEDDEEHDGKDPRTISQRVMVHTPADYIDRIVDDQQIGAT
jgi:hypothetical protein